MLNVRSGAVVCLAALILGTACGGADVTTFDGVDVDADSIDSISAEFEKGPVRASLEIDDGDLVVWLRNDGHLDASVSLNLNVDTLMTHSNTDVAEVRVAAGEELREVISAERLEGFDVAGSEWLRAELRYRSMLDSGDSWLQLTALATRDGAVVPRAEAIERGYQLADSVLEGVRIEDKSHAPTFRVCFSNALVFKPQSGGFVDENIEPNLSADTQSHPAKGLHFYATFPSTASGFNVHGDLDASGCTPQITRLGTHGSAETWKIRPIVYSFANPGIIYAVDSAGVTPGLDKIVTIPANTSPTSGVSLAYTVTEHKQLDTATFLAANTVRRATAIGVSNGNGLLRISPNVISNDRSFYCHTADPTNCPSSPSTIRIGINDANSRETVAHETGHWLHFRHASNFPRSYDYSQTDANALGTAADTPAGACTTRRSGPAADGIGTHNGTSIEWQSAAHIEGFADFIEAITYNRVSGVTNDSTAKQCHYYSGGSVRDCETTGLSLNSGCGEWLTTASFVRTGNERDWLKMYWDFLTDYSGTSFRNFSNYMQAEKNVTAWPSDGKNGHWELIRVQLAALSASQGTNWRDSARNNIFVDGTPTRSTP